MGVQEPDRNFLIVYGVYIASYTQATPTYSMLHAAPTVL